MRLDINLASNVYEDARDFCIRWGIGLGLLSVVTIGLLVMAISGFWAARQDRSQISELESKIVERAKGILQRESRLSEEEAYLTLRRQSRQQRKSMKEVAEAIVAASESQRQQPRVS